jgi:hypothetical protein
MLDLSHGVVVREFVVAIRDLYAKNRKSFSLKTLFLPVTSQSIFNEYLKCVLMNKAGANVIKIPR